jgi:signal transduction histidine kinase
MKLPRLRVRPAAPPQALAESWLVSALILAALTNVAGEVSDYTIGNGIMLVTLASAAIAGLRMRPLRGSLWSVIVQEFLLSLLLCGGTLALALLLPALMGHPDLLDVPGYGIVGTYFILLMTVPGYWGCRIFLWAWNYYNSLRRTRFQWTLTHMHLVVILIMSVPFFVLALFVLFSRQVEQATIDNPSLMAPIMSTLTTGVMPWIVVLAIMVGMAVVVVLPPSALISYLVSRPLTRRLLALAQATRALRSGDLKARVAVKGQDEMAQLQDDFNNMAADLEQKTTDLQLERDKVAALLKSQRELTAAVSHELRTPIATLGSYLDSDLDHWDENWPDNLNHDLQIMRREVDRLQTMMDDLLTLSRAEVSQLTLDINAVNLAELAGWLVETTAPLAWKNNRVEITADISDRLPAVKADAQRLEQVLRNLVQNGIRHTPPGGILAISAQTEGECMRIEVRDTGEGISAEDLPHIFERFYRADARVEDGRTGLGLALAKELVEAMGGSITAQSQPGEGSTFTLHLDLWK